MDSVYDLQSNRAYDILMQMRELRPCTTYEDAGDLVPGFCVCGWTREQHGVSP